MTTDTITLVQGKQFLRRATVMEDWWQPILVELNCRTRILIVSDGSPRFGMHGFGLSEAVDIIKAAQTTDYPIEVVTAHTGTDPNADVSNFTFQGTHKVNGTKRSLKDYQELWLFGFVGGNTGMTGPGLTAIKKFMQAGGGVFATGDHGSLGAAMCGEIPRVKSMRHWYSNVAPPGGGPERIDTNVPNPGADPQFDLQSDNIPQRIYPTWYGSAPDVVAHPLLSYGEGTVTYLPDHPHEGRCVVPPTLDPAEWPADKTGFQVPPEVVAYGVSGGPGFSGGKPSITPPVLFGVIGAYDGHRTGVGRVVVDSTWHHWININLNGAGATPLSGGVPTNGLYKGGVPTPEYLQIQAYFQNIAGWLEPNRVRICRLIALILACRWRWPLVQEIDLSRSEDLSHLLAIGKLTEKTLSRSVGTATALELASYLVDSLEEQNDQLRALVNPYARLERSQTSPLFDDSLLRAAVLGGAMMAFAVRTPDSTPPLTHVRKLMGRKRNLDRINAILSAGAQQGLGMLSQEMGRTSRQLNKLRRALPG